MWGAAPLLSADLTPACLSGSLLEEPAWPCGVGGEEQEKPRGAPHVFTHSQPLSSWRAEPGAPSWRFQTAGGRPWDHRDSSGGVLCGCDQNENTLSQATGQESRVRAAPARTRDGLLVAAITTLILSSLLDNGKEEVPVQEGPEPPTMFSEDQAEQASEKDPMLLLPHHLGS